jgi:hypothetical protein
MTTNMKRERPMHGDDDDIQEVRYRMTGDSHWTASSMANSAQAQNGLSQAERDRKRAIIRLQHQERTLEMETEIKRQQLKMERELLELE